MIGSPALFLHGLVEATKGTDVQIVAQNSYFENSGAFTGENSPPAFSRHGR